MIAKLPRTEQQDAQTLPQLIALARRRGYSNPEWWAKKIFEARRKKVKK